MHAGLALQKAVGVLALHEDRGALEAGLVAVEVIERRHLEAVALRPAVVHAEQHLGPVLRFGAAGARVERENRVLAVVLAGQQRRQAHRLDLIRDRLDLRLRLGQQREILRLVTHLDERERVLRTGAKLHVRLVLLLERGRSLQHLLRRLHIVPETGLRRLVLEHLDLLAQPLEAERILEFIEGRLFIVQFSLEFFKLQHIPKYLSKAKVSPAAALRAYPRGCLRLRISFYIIPDNPGFVNRKVHAVLRVFYADFRNY